MKDPMSYIFPEVKAAKKYTKTSQLMKLYQLQITEVVAKRK